MIATAKYKAKPVYWNLATKTVVHPQSTEGFRRNNRLQLPECICRFDSQHEFKVYLELVRMYGASNVVRQYPLEVFPKGYCYPRGKTWKVDFAIRYNEISNLPHIFIEAKGAFLPEFATTLAAFELNNPDAFDRLYVVFSNKLPAENKMLGNLLKSPIAKQLMTLKELQDSIELP
jgi:hypothetical protein